MVYLLTLLIGIVAGSLWALAIGGAALIVLALP